MLNIKTIFIGFSALLLPITTTSALAANYNKVQSLTKKDQKKLLYKYNGQIFEDVNDVLRNFLLDNPDFMSFVNVIGDVEAARVDYDRGLLNKYLLPDYDLNKISPVYKKPSGEYTTDFWEAKSAMVNPAFTRTMLTDGFGSYFALSETQTAIDSFRAKLTTGDMGIIDLDAFGDKSIGYNPLSETDFQQLKANTEKQIINLPNQVTQNNDYTHEWYVNNKTFKSFDDLFVGAENQLKELLNNTYEHFNEMRNIYSTINGYDLNNKLRYEEDIKGQNIYANNQDSLINYLSTTNGNEFDLAKGKLVTTNEDIINYRQNLEVLKNQKKKEQEDFLRNESNLMWDNYTRDSFEYNKETPMSSSINFSSFDNTKKTGTKRKGATTYRFEYRLLQSTGSNSYKEAGLHQEWPKLDDNSDTVTKNIEIPINNSNSWFNINDSNKKFKLNIKIYKGTELRGINYDVFNIDLKNDINWPSGAINKEAKPKSLKIKIQYDPVNVDGGNIFHGVDEHLPAVQVLDSDFDFDYKYDLSQKQNFDVQYGKVFLTNNQLNDLKNQKSPDQQKTLQTFFDQKTFIKYFNKSTSNFEKINSQTSVYFIREWSLVKNEDDKYEMMVKVDLRNSMIGNSRQFLKNNIFKIPIVIIEDFNETIDNLTVEQLTMSNVDFNPFSDLSHLSFQDFLKQTGTYRKNFTTFDNEKRSVIKYIKEPTASKIDFKLSQSTNDISISSDLLLKNTSLALFTNNYKMPTNNNFFLVDDLNKNLTFNIKSSFITPTENKSSFNFDAFTINLLKDIPWPSNAINKKIKINDLSFKIEYLDFLYTGYNHMFSIQIKDLNLSIDYQYDVIEEKGVKTQYSKVFLTENQLNNLKHQSSLGQQETLKSLFDEKTFIKYFNQKTNNFEKLDNTNNDYLISKLELKQNSNLTYSVVVTVDVKNKTINGKKHYLETNVFEIPIIIIEQFDSTINDSDSLNEQFDYLNDWNSHFPLANNLNNFNDFLSLEKNASQQIVFSYQQFKYLMNFIKNNPDQKMYFLLTTKKQIKLNKKTETFDFQEPLLIDLSMLPKSFINLMDNKNQIKNYDNLKLIIDFSKINLSLKADKLNNINFKWLLNEQYTKYQNPNTPLPTTNNIDEIKSTSFETDGLYDALIKIGKELNYLIVKEKESNTIHPFLKFIDQLNFSSYTNLVKETLNLNDQILWKIQRFPKSGKFEKLIFANTETYTLEQFFAVVKQDTIEEKQLVDTIIEAIETNDYFRMAKYIGSIDFNEPKNDLEKIAYPYLKTLRLYINKNSINGSLPGGQKFTFPNLDHIFISNLPVINSNYIIANQYQLNGSLVIVGQEESIAQVFGPNEQEELIATKEMIKKHFTPPRVIQIFDIDGNEFSNKNSNDSEDIAIINAQNIANPKLVNNYVFYEDFNGLVLNLKSTIYHIEIADSDLDYYFRTYTDALEFVKNYMMLFVEVIRTGGNYA